MRKRVGDQPDEVNPEWTVEDFRRARPLLEVLPKEVVDAIKRSRGQRGPQKEPTKELINLRSGRRKAVAKRRSSTAKRRA